MNNSNKLLTRDQFQEMVFKRDNYRCVFCNKPAVDAHHILDRKLFSDGGYYLNNGASVCSEHHLQCELTLLSVESVRKACGITTNIVPNFMYENQSYDKWGNPILLDGHRSRGPLFHDDNVQKVLKQAGLLHIFNHYSKAARTLHFTWSPGVQSDDKVIQSLDAFINKEVILTNKRDGENTSMYRDYFHARSIDSRFHPSRSWVKSKWAQICGDIPEGWRVTGENVFATHSIHYTDLETYFYGFGIWDEQNIRLGWDTILEWFALLDITPVETLYRGPFDERVIRDICESIDTVNNEGAVLTTVDGFSYNDYHKNVAKWVRPGHVQTDSHWQHAQVVPNKLKT